MSRSISVEDLKHAVNASAHANLVVIDVRKVLARAQSGETIAGALYRSPFSADLWWQSLAGRKVAVFCVHGHEVSQAVCGFLRDCRVDAVYLEGGFAAWQAAGGPCRPIGQLP